ncbi:MAG: hypothetical protein IPM98_20280 [Lewinellaceae bacterium]|nr:hypothetical protein [Lewinellaceae bacterium]
MNINVSDFNEDVTFNDTPDACTAVNAINCTNCVGAGCTPSVSCKSLANVDMEGCASDVPAAVTDPATIFTYEACGATVTMSQNDNGDVNFCGDGDGVDFIRTYTLLFNGVPQTPTCSHTIEVYDTTDPTFPACPQAPADLGCNLPSRLLPTHWQKPAALRTTAAAHQP